MSKKKRSLAKNYPNSKNIKTPTHQIVRRTHSSVELTVGPIPDPETLERYEKASPGSAAIIINGFKEQSEHRHRLESAHMGASIEKEKRGQWMAFIILLIAIISGSFLVWQGKSISGLITSIGGLATALTALVYGKSTQEKKLQKKREAIESSS